MKAMAMISGLLLSAFGLFLFKISTDMLFPGEEVSSTAVLTYGLFLVCTGLLPYVLGVFLCYWGLGRKETEGSAIKAFLAVALSFKGRISRKTWWLAMLAIFPIYLVLDSGRKDIAASPLGTPQLVVLVLVFLCITWPMLAIQVKRWHDQDRPAYWVLINLIPVIGPLIGIILLGGKDGSEGENRYGKDPQGRRSPAGANHSLLEEPAG